MRGFGQIELELRAALGNRQRLAADRAWGRSTGTVGRGGRKERMVDRKRELETPAVCRLCSVNPAHGQVRHASTSPSSKEVFWRHDPLRGTSGEAC